MRNRAVLAPGRSSRMKIYTFGPPSRRANVNSVAPVLFASAKSSNLLPNREVGSSDGRSRTQPVIRQHAGTTLIFNLQPFCSYRT